MKKVLIIILGILVWHIGYSQNEKILGPNYQIIFNDGYEDGILIYNDTVYLIESLSKSIEINNMLQWIPYLEKEGERKQNVINELTLQNIYYQQVQDSLMASNELLKQSNLEAIAAFNDILKKDKQNQINLRKQKFRNAGWSILKIGIGFGVGYTGGYLHGKFN